MQRFKNILASIDTLAEEHPTLQCAAALAEHNEASLKLVDVLPEAAWPWRLATPNYEHVQELLEKEKRENLERLAEPIRAKGISVSTKVLHGRSSAGIIEEVINGRHDLVIRRPKGALSRRSGHFGSTTMRLLRRCPCAVWVVKGGGGAEINKVLAAVDPAPRDTEHADLNKTIMELTLALCEREQAEPMIVHVWNLYGEGIFKGRMNEEQFEALEHSARESVEKSYREFLEPYGLTYPSEKAELFKGEPGTIIPQLVKRDHIDLVVMGTVARTGVPGLVMGNTAEMILQQIECGVLAVKPAGFQVPK